MALYYVNMNAQDSGDHEVHVSTCDKLPNPENRLYLGMYQKCQDAVEEAKKTYSQSNGCFFCCNECNTG